MAISALKMFQPYSGDAANSPGGRGNGAANRIAVWSDANTLTSVANLTADISTGVVRTPSQMGVGAAALTTSAFTVNVGGSLMTGTTQSGAYVNQNSSTAATSGLQGYAVNITLAASTTTGYMINYSAGGMGKGAGSTVTRTVQFFGSVDTIGTNNAWATDNVSFTGNYVFNFTSTAASVLAGALTVNGQLIGLGTATNDSAAAGYIGEYLASTVLSDTDFGTTAQYFDLTSKSLTAGDWDVTLLVYVNPNSGTITTPLEIGISTTTGNSSTGLDKTNTARIDTPASTTTTISGVVPVYRMSLAATTTVYAKMFSNYSGSPKYQCRLSARRVR